MSRGPRVVMRPIWRHLLFLHWPVAVEQLRPLIPPALEIDTFDGQAYIGLVPFTMLRVLPPGLPSGRWHGDFHEVNVRTYVRHQSGAPGVWFYSLDASNIAAVCAARAWYKLPYHHARMSLTRRSGEITYDSQRRWPTPLPAACHIHYCPTGTPAPAAAGSLEHFLVERYCLYSAWQGRLYCGRVRHKPYPLQTVEVLDMEEDLIAAAGVQLPTSVRPLVHYAYEVRTEIMGLQDINEPGE